MVPPKPKPGDTIAGQAPKAKPRPAGEVATR